MRVKSTFKRSGSFQRGIYIKRERERESGMEILREIKIMTGR